MQDASAFVEAALSALERALHARGHELRNVQLATTAPEGRPGLRTVVLRDFQRAPFRAEIHTDARAAKVREISYSGHVTLLAWSAADRLQVRFEGVARLHRGDDVARDRWDALSPGARKPYGLKACPGTPIASPDDQPQLPAGEQFQQFTVIRIALSTVDILRLEAEGGQTRACADLRAAPFEARWVGA